MTLCVYVFPPCEEAPSNRFWVWLRLLWAYVLMALCVRKLEGKRQWEDPRIQEPWLGPNDLRADALRDLATEQDKLSVYEVTDAVPLPRILAALAANRVRLVKLDYILFDSAILDEQDIVRERIEGKTCDAGVNGCHIDLVQLTAEKLSRFGARIRAARKAERHLPRTVTPLIQDSIDRGFIDWSKLQPELAAKLRAPAR